MRNSVVITRVNECFKGEPSDRFDQENAQNSGGEVAEGITEWIFSAEKSRSCIRSVSCVSNFVVCVPVVRDGPRYQRETKKEYSFFSVKVNIFSSSIISIAVDRRGMLFDAL